MNAKSTEVDSDASGDLGRKSREGTANSLRSFDDSLPMALLRAREATMRLFRPLLSDHDLTEQQWRVLRVLWSENKVTAADLSRQTLLSAPSLVGILDRLENKQLIARVRSTTDRREVYIVTTNQGRKLREKILPSVGQIHEEIRSRVSQEEWDVMVATLAKLSGNSDVMRPTIVQAQETLPDSNPQNKRTSSIPLKSSA